MKSMSRDVSPAVIERVPQYLWCVRSHRDRGRDYVNSTEIARVLGLTASTVRQDFSHLGLTGTSKLGYDTHSLNEALTKLLDIHREKRVVIVGAGNLGRALALHGNFTRYGFFVTAIVDTNPDIIGKKVGDLTVHPMKDILNIVQQEKLDIGIIAVPAESAQKVADHLILTGIKGLLNMAFTRIVAPANVTVVNARIVSDLLRLSFRMAE